MRARRRFALRAAVLCAALCGQAAHAADWLRAQSEHFTITTDSSERRAAEYLQELEALHHVVLLIMGVEPAKTQAKPRFELYLLRDPRDLAKVRPHFANGIGGVHMLCSEGSVAYVGLPSWGLGHAEDPGLQILFHEYAHHVMFQYATAFYPAWYVEGFAEFFGKSQISGDKVVLGDTARGNALWLRSRPWIDFQRVLKPPFKATGDKDADRSDFEAFYNQSWLLVHYMLSDSARTKLFNDYFARLGEGEDPIAAFEPATGIPVAKLAGALRRHLDNLPVVAVSSGRSDKGAVRVEALPAEVDGYLLDASVLRTCAPKAQGQAILQRLKAQEAKGNAPVELKLARARAEFLFGEPKAALAALQELAAAHETSFDAQHLLGRALAESADELEGEARTAARAQARAQLFKAYRLQKNDAPNLYQMARVMAVDGVNANVLNAAQGARALAPGVGTFATFEALVDLDAGERTRALRALAPLASNPHDPAYAARMRAAMQAIRAGLSRNEVQRAMSETVP